MKLKPEEAGLFYEMWPCEKISVNSTTVIKNDIAGGLKNSRSIFLYNENPQFNWGFKKLKAMGRKK